MGCDIQKHRKCIYNLLKYTSTDCEYNLLHRPNTTMTLTLVCWRTSFEIESATDTCKSKCNIFSGLTLSDIKNGITLDQSNAVNQSYNNNMKI